MDTSPQVKIADLTNALLAHDKAYYKDDEPVISDSDYDDLRRELIELETVYPEFKLENSPSNHVGSSLLVGDVPVKFEVPMLSLGNIFNAEETTDFLHKTRVSLEQDIVDFVVEPKLDGLAIRAVWLHGRFETGNTRGTGREGEDLTTKLPNIDNFPKVINSPNVPAILEVRGEVVVSLPIFHAINAELLADGKKAYSSPRNYAAGVLRRSNPAEVIGAGLSFIVYQVMDSADLAETHWGAMNFVKHLGFTINEMELVDDDEQVLNAIASVNAGRETSLFEWDGAVIKVNRYDQQALMGAGTKDLRWATAFKFPAEEKLTKVTDIIVQVGRTGAVTPVAFIEPVRLAGAIVTRANLKNIAEIENLGIGIGAVVAVVRSGEVIPDICRVVGEVKTPFVFPTECPACSTTLERRGPKMYCPSSSCKGQLLARMLYFTGRTCANIKGLGEKSLAVLIDRKMVEGILDIYGLDESDLQPLFGGRIATKMLAAIERSKGMTLSKTLTSLGIPEIGPSTAKAIAEFFGNGEDLCEQYDNPSLDVYPDVGVSAGDSFRTFFSNEDNVILLYNLIYRDISTGVEEQPVVGELTGKVFAITGSVDGYTKDSITRLLKAKGATMSSSVNKKVHYLIVGETPGDKLTKAIKLSIPILNKASFEAML